MASEKDVESRRPARIPWFKQVMDQAGVTDDVMNAHYEGSGTEEDPYIVQWIDDDPRNPMNYSQVAKWALTATVAVATLAVAFVSSAYSGGVGQILAQFEVGSEVVTLGISLFVIGFAIGPLLWAPMSELFGRQYLFIATYAMLTFFNAGAAGSQNVQTLIILRFFAGAFGSSPLTNAGGVIADMFPASQRGLAMTLFASAPFLGPTLGPIVGGFVGETIGWRWIEGIMAIFTGVMWIVGAFVVPETYSPVLLRKRAKKMSQMTGKVYKSRADAELGKVTITQAFKTSLSRPWILLFREPIVLLLSIYMAIVYGTLYMLFAAFPIVYEEVRGWSPGIGGLSFIGVMVGEIFAVAYAVWDNKRYINTANNSKGGFAPPEARLPPGMVGGIALPIGLFWFAWTNSPNVHWAASIVGAAPFGFGMVLVFLAIMNYLIDAYVIFAASVLAANAVLRSIFGAVFPLFTSYMYRGIGIHWASTVPAFLALVCVPFPFLFYKYGPAIRVRCKFAAEADAFMKKMRGEIAEEENDVDADADAHDSDESSERTKAEHDGATHAHPLPTDERKRLALQHEANREAEAIDYSWEDEAHQPDTGGRFQRIKVAGEQGPPQLLDSGSMNSADGKKIRRAKSKTSMLSTQSREYEGNPYDIDRVNTHDSFARVARTRSRAGSARSVARSLKK